MVLNDYYETFEEGFDFLIAIGSVIGVFGIIIGMLGLMVLSNKYKSKMAFVLLPSIFLVILCGFDTGLRYFGMY